MLQSLTVLRNQWILIRVYLLTYLHWFGWLKVANVCTHQDLTSRRPEVHRIALVSHFLADISRWRKIEHHHINIESHWSTYLCRKILCSSLNQLGRCESGLLRVVNSIFLPFLINADQGIWQIDASRQLARGFIIRNPFAILKFQMKLNKNWNKTFRFLNFVLWSLFWISWWGDVADEKY